MAPVANPLASPGAPPISSARFSSSNGEHDVNAVRSGSTSGVERENEMDAGMFVTGVGFDAKESSRSPSPLLRYPRDRRSITQMSIAPSPSPSSSSNPPQSASQQSLRLWRTGNSPPIADTSPTTSPASGPSIFTYSGAVLAPPRASTLGEFNPSDENPLKGGCVIAEDNHVVIDDDDDDHDHDLDIHRNIDQRLDHLIDLTRDLLTFSRHALNVPPGRDYQDSYASRGSNAIQELETAYEQIESERTIGRITGMSTLDSGFEPGLSHSSKKRGKSIVSVGQPSPTPTSRVKSRKGSIWSTAFNLLPLRSIPSPSRQTDPIIPHESKDVPMTPASSRPALSQSNSHTLSYSFSSTRSSFSQSNGHTCAPTTPSGRSGATQAASPTMVTRSSYSSWLNGEDDDAGVGDEGESPAKKKILDLLNGYKG